MASKKPVSELRQRAGANIAALADKASLTATELGKKTGISRSVMSRILNLEKAPTVDQIEQLATALNTTAQALMHEDAEGVEDVRTTSGETMPEGLAGFLEREGERLGVTAQERFYLQRSRFHTDAWVIRNDKFWSNALDFVRNVLKDSTLPIAKSVKAKS